ncbi:MAG: FG-GAP repeat domain-containing protein [Verrucomicrobiia bacterium]
MKPLPLPALSFLGWIVALTTASAGEAQFKHHYIDSSLPINAQGYGDYGLTALVDLDHEGDLDFVIGGRAVQPPQLFWYEFRQPDVWVQHLVGTNYMSDVGLAALDVDYDGWTDLVCSGVWFRNTGKPRQQPFERIVFDPNASGAHDVLIADLNQDERPDVVFMGDGNSRLNALCWYEIATDPKQPWKRHPIGPPVHGAITPNAAVDLDGDGDLDIIRADTWFENVNGKGTEWKPHTNIPMGRKGPFGVCVRTAVADMDGDGKKEIVMADADIEDSKIVILKNADGKGGRWEKTPLPQSFRYGSLHALAVADFNLDGRPDIVACEQEELLPDGRENPRWVLWENLGEGKFAERIILDAKLGGHELQAGDVDRDGDIDICSKAWGPRPWNANGGRMHVDFLENLLKR